MLGRHSSRGQTLVELVLVLPLLLMLLIGIISLGIGVFYQQQLANAAREAARYAAVHSATAQCPTVSTLPPLGANKPLSYAACDRPDAGWPKMTAAARDAVFGLPRNQMHVTACWSGYRTATSYDAWVPGTYNHVSPPVVVSASDSVFRQCRIAGHDPTSASTSIPCAPGLATTDEGSAVSEAPGRPVGNTVTAYACFVWSPPLAGFLLLPDSVTLRAVVTEAIQRQQ